jgi:protocatechuate 3,4-dioxygenase beta subunit
VVSKLLGGEVNGLALTRSARVSGVAGKILLTIFFLLVFIGSAIARQRSSPSLTNSIPPSGEISGHVYSAATGAPVAKAVVTLVRRTEGESARIESVQTDSGGAFIFASLAAGKYELSAERCGFISQSFVDTSSSSGDSGGTLALAAGQKRDGLDFQMPRGGVISGSVTDQDGEPVPKLMVQALAFPYQPGGAQTSNPPPESRIFTDDLGNFRIADLNPGSYYIIVGSDVSHNATAGNTVYRETAYPGVYSARDAKRVRVDAGSETAGIRIAVRLEKAFALRGHVHGVCQPNAGISCLIFAWDTGSFTTEHADNVTAEADGSFELSGLFPAQYSVRVIAIQKSNEFPERFLGVGNARAQVLDRDTETDVSVGPLVEISGVVVDENSKPLSAPGIQIVLSETTGAENVYSELEIGDDLDVKTSSVNSQGRFDISVIGSGTYAFGLDGSQSAESGIEMRRLGATHPLNKNLMYVKEVLCSGHDYARQPLALTPAMRLSDCQLKIGHDTASISGKVMNGDKGVGGKIVVVIPESPELRRNPRYTMIERTDRDGQFSIDGIVPGDYLIFAVAPNEERSYYALDFADRNFRDAERATFKSGEAKTFVLKPSSAQ